LRRFLNSPLSRNSENWTVYATFSEEDSVMLMADTMAIFLVVLGFLLAFPGLWLLSRGLWPQTVAGAASICSKGLIKPFLAGLPITVAMVIAAAMLAKLGTAGKIIATALVCLHLMIANIGASGLATCIGERLASASDRGQAWRATLRGGVALELSFLPPILGWFGVLPLAMTIGCGAAAIALLSRRISLSASESSSSTAEQAGFRVTGSLEAER
jgi:hypothetical protein